MTDPDREQLYLLLILIAGFGIALVVLNLHYDRGPARTHVPRSFPRPGDPTGGRAVFRTHRCPECHTVRRIPAARGTMGPDLDGVATRAAHRVPGMSADAYLRQSITDPSAYVVRGYLDAMPRLRAGMTDQEFEDLVAFLHTLKRDSTSWRGEPPPAPTPALSKGGKAP